MVRAIAAGAGGYCCQVRLDQVGVSRRTGKARGKGGCRFRRQTGGLPAVSRTTGWPPPAVWLDEGHEGGIDPGPTSAINASSCRVEVPVNGCRDRGCFPGIKQVRRPAPPSARLFGEGPVRSGCAGDDLVGPPTSRTDQLAGQTLVGSEDGGMPVRSREHGIDDTRSGPGYDSSPRIMPAH